MFPAGFDFLSGTDMSDAGAPTEPIDPRVTLPVWGDSMLRHSPNPQCPFNTPMVTFNPLRGHYAGGQIVEPKDFSRRRRQWNRYAAVFDPAR